MLQLPSQTLFRCAQTCEWMGWRIIWWKLCVSTFMFSPHTTGLNVGKQIQVQLVLVRPQDNQSTVLRGHVTSSYLKSICDFSVKWWKRPFRACAYVMWHEHWCLILTAVFTAWQLRVAFLRAPLNDVAVRHSPHTCQLWSHSPECDRLLLKRMRQYLLRNSRSLSIESMCLRLLFGLNAKSIDVTIGLIWKMNDFNLFFQSSLCGPSRINIS